MVRTASTANRVASGGKSAKAVARSGANKVSTSSSNEKSGGGGNPVHPRETPSWQKPISSFFTKTDHKEAEKPNDVVMKDAAVAHSSSSVNRDTVEAGSSKGIYGLRNVHIDNNNDDEGGLNNNNNGSYNNNNNNNVPDHNNQKSDDKVSENIYPEGSSESMDVDDSSNPSASGYQIQKNEDEAGSSNIDKENLDDNMQVTKRTHEQGIVDNPPKKLKPEHYKFLQEFESVDQ